MTNDLNVDPMLFLALVIEDQVAVLDVAALSTEMFGPMTGLGTGITDIAWEHIAQAQADLDRLIAEDTTWRDA